MISPLVVDLDTWRSWPESQRRLAERLFDHLGLDWRDAFQFVIGRRVWLWVYSRDEGGRKYLVGDKVVYHVEDADL